MAGNFKMSSFKKLKILYNKTGKLNCYNTEIHRVRHFFECYSAFTLRQIIPLIFSLLLDPPQLPNCKVNDISIWSSYILIVSQVLTWLFDFPLSTPDGNLSSWGSSSVTHVYDGKGKTWDEFPVTDFLPLLFWTHGNYKPERLFALHFRP